MSLDQYTEQQLMDEVLNRRIEDELGFEDLEYCEDCRHFTPYTRRGEVPETYNACGRKHTMKFRTPEGWEGPYGGGFYRRFCSDRLPIEPPAPPKPPEQPVGLPDWKPTILKKD